jgi:energy-coupling factor transport system permease protein
MTPQINTWAWVGWLISTLILISRTRNPLYLTIIFFVVLILATRLNRLTGKQRPVLLIRLAISFILLSTIFNALFAHYGATRLFAIPEALPILGGAITLEAMVYGAINGLVLASIFGAFIVVSMALPARSIIRLVPRAYYPVAVVLSIALTFLPNTLRHFTQIREAQAVRGHRMRGFRDWLPLVMPLLIGGLERAFNLSESMTARGFSSQQDGRQTPGRQITALLSLCALLAGWILHLQGKMAPASIFMMVLGGSMIVWLLWRSGRSSPVTIYRQEPWTIEDSLILLGASVSLVVFLLPLPGSGPSYLAYNPYPKLTMPGFNAWIGISILGLIVPLWGMRQAATSRSAGGQKSSGNPGSAPIES